MANRKIALVTDSTANLNQDQIDRFDINIMPLILIWGAESYRDGVDITTGRFHIGSAKWHPRFRQDGRQDDA